MNEQDNYFGELRAMMHAPDVGASWIARVQELLTGSFLAHPSRHTEEVIPYLEHFHEAWSRTSIYAHSLQKLEQWHRIAPFLRVELELEGAHQQHNTLSLCLDDGYINQVVRTSGFGMVVGLEMSFHSLTYRGVQILLGQVEPGQLRSLACLAGHHPLGDEGVAVLAESSHLVGLERLELASEGLSDVAVELLVQSDCMSSMVSLDLGGNPVGLRGVEALGGSHTLQELTCLDLSFTNLDDDSVTVLSTFPALKTLRELDLSENAIGDEGARALACSPHLAYLQGLHLHECSIEFEGAKALAESLYLSAEIRTYWREKALNIWDHTRHGDLPP